MNCRRMAYKTVRLNDAELEMNSMIETKETLWTTLSWTITNFTKLKNNVGYYCFGSLLHYYWELKLTKLDEELVFIFDADCADEFVNFAIIGDGNHILNGGLSIDNEDGEFSAKFDMVVIMDSKNGYLKNDSLVVQCRFVEMDSIKDKIRVIPWDEHRERIDLVELQTEWREMYLQSRFWDFKIVAQGNVFYTHKVILTARSRFFANNFAKEGPDAKNEITLSASPYLLHEVLMFMYTGELVNMHPIVLLDVYELAVNLGIKSLLQKCYCRFRKDMDNDIVLCLHKKAQKLKDNYLLRVCEHFMEANCPEILQTLQKSHENN